MERALRWVLAILVVAAIIGLISFARGTPEHGDAAVPPAAAASIATVA